MADPFETYTTSLTAPARRHFAITPADSDLAIVPRALFVTGDGNLVIRDQEGTDLPYAVTAGMIVPFHAVQVRAATTATVIGWY
jgi:hypothetical protein